MTTISPIQERAVQLLLSGFTVAAAARELGIDRTTIYTWRKNHAHFATACQQARKLHSDFLADSLHDLASTALDTLREILVAKDAPPAVRLRAAQAVLNAAAASPSPKDSTEFDTFPPSQETSIDETENQGTGTFRRETSATNPAPVVPDRNTIAAAAASLLRSQIVATGSEK
jgi:transposase-like protein